MAISGIAWGAYLLRGRGVASPVQATAANFVRAAILMTLVSAGAFMWACAEGTGVLLALVSGTVTSGLGYVLWYKALRGLTTTQASIVQLLVPVLAAL